MNGADTPENVGVTTASNHLAEGANAKSLPEAIVGQQELCGLRAGALHRGSCRKLGRWHRICVGWVSHRNTQGPGTLLTKSSSAEPRQRGMLTSRNAFRMMQHGAIAGASATRLRNERTRACLDSKGDACASRSAVCRGLEVVVMPQEEAAHEGDAVCSC
jgi:hypothetical protein